jgi:hypothetical protein
MRLNGSGSHSEVREIFMDLLSGSRHFISDHGESA